MPADIERLIRAAAPDPAPPDTRSLWERGRRRRRRRRAATGAACLAVLALLAIGVGVARQGGGVRVETDAPFADPGSPSTIDTGAAGWTTFTDTEAGFAVDLPPGWSATTEPLSGLTDPVERLTAASYPLRRHAHGDDDLPACQVPLPAAIADGGATGAFATIMEATGPASGGWVPDHRISDGSFEDVPNRLEGPLCDEQAVATGSDLRWVWFGDGARFFYLAVAVGPETPDGTRAELWRMLDSFRPV